MPYGIGVSPTIFRAGPFRFYFFSREEPRMHVHVQSPDGEAKFWIEPHVELAHSHGIAKRELARIERIVIEHENEIRQAWSRHLSR